MSIIHDNTCSCTGCHVDNKYVHGGWLVLRIVPGKPDDDEDFFCEVLDGGTIPIEIIDDEWKKLITHMIYHMRDNEDRANRGLHLNKGKHSMKKLCENIYAYFKVPSPSHWFDRW
jgi:hypothetical protein